MDALALPLGLIGMFAGPVAISFATFRGASLTVGACHRIDRAA